jgi:hypothetical protein
VFDRHGVREVARELLGVLRLHLGRAADLRHDEQPGLAVAPRLGMPPTAEATTGVSHAIASRLMIPNGS